MQIFGKVSGCGNRNDTDFLVLSFDCTHVPMHYTVSLDTKDKIDEIVSSKNVDLCLQLQWMPSSDSFIFRALQGTDERLDKQYRTVAD